MDCFVGPKTEASSMLMNSLLTDRRLQFVERLGWNLCVGAEGHEIDEYDGDGTVYLIAHADQRHIGSCRVRPVHAGTMLMDHFRSTFPDCEAFIQGQSDRLWELTRFCKSPSASTSEGFNMLEILADALDDFRDGIGLTGFVAVIYPEVGRFLKRIGVRFIRVSRSFLDGDEVHLICITHCVKPQIILSRRQAAFKTAA